VDGYTIVVHHDLSHTALLLIEWGIFLWTFRELTGISTQNKETSYTRKEGSNERL